MPKPQKAKPGIVVAVLNLKGGVGKTTISAHVFRHLFAQLGKSTLLVDFDPQFNLTQAIISQDDYEVHKAAARTIRSVFEDHSKPSLFKTSDSIGPPPPLSSVEVKLRYLTSKPDVTLSLVPGDFEIARYSLIADANLLEPLQSRFLEFIQKAQLERAVVCLDCNPSSSFLTLCALRAATHILVPVRPDRYSLLGLKLLSEFVDKVPALNPKPKLLIVLNGLRTSGYDPQVEDELRAHAQFGPLTLANGLYISKLLEASQSYTGFATDRRHNWRVTPRISAIVSELSQRLKL